MLSAFDNHEVTKEIEAGPEQAIARELWEVMGTCLLL